MLPELLLRLRTARHLKFSQTVYYVVRRYLPLRRVKITATPSVRIPLDAEPPCEVRGIYVDNSTFRFLNHEVNLSSGEDSFNWAAKGEQRLWRYNLHYFDYLREAARTNQNRDDLIQSWVDNNPQGSQPGWEPYTASLRIVNWIFYLRSRPPADIPTRWLDSLFLQVRWLECNDERHILANHYFENLKAFLFAGCFFDGIDAARWRRHAQVEIQFQLREQTLSDGGHFERSHQYHCRMLENYLDIINLSKAYPDLCSAAFIADVREIAKQGLEYLKTTLFPDKTIPLFNDSALDISISPTELLAYADRFHLDVGHARTEKSNLINCPDSGLYGYRVADDMFLIDCGDIGPSYQPGHTHCDFLSYELMLANRRVVVDTGVCQYEPGPLRNYVRSTKAHNTVVVDSGEQSEIWGEFRVARRAKKLAAQITRNHNIVEFVGAFRGFYNVRNQIEHERTVAIELSPEGNVFRKLSVTDQLHGRGDHLAESYTHFHPDITLKPIECGGINLIANGSRIAVIRKTAGQEFRIESAIYCPEFGKRIPNQVLIFRHQAPMPFTLSYEIEIIFP